MEEQKGIDIKTAKKRTCDQSHRRPRSCAKLKPEERAAREKIWNEHSREGHRRRIAEQREAYRKKSEESGISVEVLREISSTERLLTKLISDADPVKLSDALDICADLETLGATFLEGSRSIVLRYEDAAFQSSHDYSQMIRKLSTGFIHRDGSAEALDVYKRSLKFDGRVNFDCAMRYSEFNRDRGSKFYEPRRKQLKQVADAMQMLEDRKIHTLGIMLPPGTGKTTIEVMFLCWTMLKNPELSNIMSSHSNEFLRGIYDEVLRMLDPNGEYLWWDLFPEVGVSGTNAKDLRIDVGEPKRFQSLQLSSVGSGNAGKIRASNILACDDLVDGIEAAMSPDRMDKLWSMYNTDLRQRKTGDAAELIVATPWSLRDPIDRLEQIYEDSEDAMFIHVPALDKNGESNFDYPHYIKGGGYFTTEAYEDLKNLMDDASWNALYMTQPIEREGQLYSPDELQRFYAMPDREPDATLAVCDIADGGGDYWAMPIVYKYNQQYFVVDWICDNGKPDIVEDRIVDKLIKHNVQMARFESNRGGGRVAESIQKKLRDKGSRCKVTARWNQSNKETRIIVSSGWVKDSMLFRSDKDADKEYRLAMRLLTSYSMAGRNKHDDVPDSLSMFSDFVTTVGISNATVMKRIF